MLFCLVVCQSVGAKTDAYLGWFNDADIKDSVKVTAPANAPVLIDGGTAGKCLDLSTKPLGMTMSMDDLQKHGAISFWLRPKWNGKVATGGSMHKLLRIGDPAENGLQIEVNNANGLLRFMMAGKNGSDKKVTVARTDVSSWKAGDWHHVMVSWIDCKDTALGLAIWIDKVPVMSTIFGGTEFMNPAAMTDQDVYVGDPSANACMDELIVRNTLDAADVRGGTPIAYRDYFRTAPYTAIQITHAPQQVKSDKRAVEGFKKQFGVIATKVINPSKGTKITEPITCFDGPHGSDWEDFDARREITWNTSDNAKATVDANGLVTGVAVTTAPIQLSADFRGMHATYPLTVISPDKPDLDVTFVERTPRYHKGKDKVKVWPYEGETVSSIIHYANFGFKASPATKIKVVLIPDSNKNYVLDANELNNPKKIVKTINVGGLEPGASDVVTYGWKWPSYPVFVSVTIDPEGKIDEICEANNQRCELNIARAVHWGYGQNDNQFTDDWKAKTMNLVGSFSDYDWCHANCERWNVILRTAVLPTTTPMGVQDATRVDLFHTIKEYFKEHENPDGQECDGGYEEMWDTRMTLSPGNIHEMGHNVMGLPDMYGHSVAAYNVLVQDDNGKPYGETPYIPSVSSRESTAPWTSATWGYQDELGIGYTALMVHNHLWLDGFIGGLIQKYHGQRKGLGEYCDNFGRMVPNKNSLQITDLNDQPLKNAQVYAYQCINTGYVYMANKYYPNRPKFVFTDGGTGTYAIPTKTCTTWDDYDTDSVEGSVPSPTPFDRGAHGEVPSSGIHWQAGEMLLLKIVSNGQVEFHTLPLTEMIKEWFCGRTDAAVYQIRTSLISSSSPAPVVLPKVADAIKTKNLRPIAKVNGMPDGSVGFEINAKKGEVITLDGSGSYDPEGQSLYYRWDGYGGPTTDTKRVVNTGNMPDGDHEFKFYVTDGLRFSECFVVTIHLK